MEDNTPGSVIEPLDSSTQLAPAPESAAPESPPKAKPPKKRSFLSRIREFSSLYFVSFLVLLMLVIAATVIALTRGDDQRPGGQSADSLTDAQLAQLQGNTTVVGDPQQTLDIQSNTIVQGQLLARKDLDVAGSLKVGGEMTLSSVKVSGQADFGQLQINGILSVSGDATLGGQLSVQRNLNVAGSGSFSGNLSANKLTVSTLQLNGDLQVNRHIVVGGSIPGKTNGSALGGGGTASVNGSDTAGTITINTGGGPPAGCFVTINFTNQFSSTPHVVISPSNSNAGSLNYYTNRSAGSFSVCSANAPSASTNYIFDYIVLD